MGDFDPRDESDEHHLLLLESWLGQHVPALKWECADDVAARINGIMTKHGYVDGIDAGQVASIRDVQMRKWSDAKAWARDRSKNNCLELN